MRSLRSRPLLGSPPQKRFARGAPAPFALTLLATPAPRQGRRGYGRAVAPKRRHRFSAGAAAPHRQQDCKAITSHSGWQQRAAGLWPATAPKRQAAAARALRAPVAGAARRHLLRVSAPQMTTRQVRSLLPAVAVRRCHCLPFWRCSARSLARLPAVAILNGLRCPLRGQRWRCVATALACLLQSVGAVSQNKSFSAPDLREND